MFDLESVRGLAKTHQTGLGFVHTHHSDPREELGQPVALRLVEKLEGRKEDVLTPGSQVRLNGSKSWAAKTRFACCPKQGSSVGFDVTNWIICCSILDDHRYHVGGTLPS